MDEKIPRRLPAVSSDRMEYLNQPVLEPQLHFVMVFDGRLDEARLRRALRLVMDAEPVFGCRYVSARRPYWQRRDDLDSLSLCDVVESSDVRRELTEFRARPCDAAVDPLLQALIVRGPSDTLGIKISHCVADGAGAKDLIALIASIYRNLGNNPAYRVTPNLGSRSRMQLFRQFGLRGCLKIWRRASAAGARRPPRNQWRFPSSNRQDRGAVLYSMRRLPPESFDVLRAYAKTRGATLNDVFITACFRSLFQFLDAGVTLPQTVLIPMNLRRFLPSGKTAAICNLVTLLSVPLARIPDEPFQATLARVAESSQDSPQKNDRAIFGALGSALLYRLISAKMKGMIEQVQRQNILDGRTMAFFSSNGALQPEDMDFGPPVADAYEIVLPAAPPGFFMVVVSFRKTLTFTVSYCSRAVLPEVMEAFLDHFVQQLPAAVAGSESPGDFHAAGTRA